VRGFFRFTPEGRIDAKAAFQRVLEIEPTYTPALTALGHTYYQAARYQDNADPRIDLEQAMEISDKLLALEGCEANGYALLANVRFTEGRHDEALDACQRAVQLEPESPDHLGRYAHLLMYAGEFKMALYHLHKSLQLSPHHPNWFTTTEVLAHFFLDELDEAQEAAERALQRFPDFPHAHINLASVYAARGMGADANKVAENFQASRPLFSVHHYVKSQLFRDPVHARTWADCMLRSGLPA